MSNCLVEKSFDFSINFIYTQMNIQHRTTIFCIIWIRLIKNITKFFITNTTTEIQTLKTPIKTKFIQNEKQNPTKFLAFTQNDTTQYSSMNRTRNKTKIGAKPSELISLMPENFRKAPCRKQKRPRRAFPSENRFIMRRLRRIFPVFREMRACITWYVYVPEMR